MQGGGAEQEKEMVEITKRRMEDRRNRITTYTQKKKERAREKERPTDALMSLYL